MKREQAYTIILTIVTGIMIVLVGMQIYHDQMMAYRHWVEEECQKANGILIDRNDAPLDCTEPLPPMMWLNGVQNYELLAPMPNISK